MTHPFTPTYIAMAKAAEEIQAGHTAWNGDYCLFGYPERPDLAWEIRFEDSPVNFPIGRKPGEFFIPRLDQLLAMVPHDTYRELEGRPDTFFERAGTGYEDADYEEGVSWIVATVNEKKYPQKDWHELALAVVMKEKHSKTWRDGKWNG